jgi:hypothetical protein
MSFLAKALPILFTLVVGTVATLPTSYDVAWTTPGVNGSADSMPLGGGDIGINTWYEDGKLLSNLNFEIKNLTSVCLLRYCTFFRYTCSDCFASSYIWLYSAYKSTVC